MPLSQERQANGKMDLFGTRSIIPLIDQTDSIRTGQTTFTTAPSEFVSKFRIGDKTPSVTNSNTWMFINKTAFNVSYFQGGQPGQTIHILGDGHTTLVHKPGSIYTSTQANILLADQLCYSFKLFKLPAGYQWSQVVS